MSENFQHIAGQTKTKQTTMITTERFNTLLQEQTASGYLTPIDSEQTLAEIRGGETTIMIKGTHNFDDGSNTFELDLGKSGVRVNFKYDGHKLDYSAGFDPAKVKDKTSSQKSPVAPSGGTPNTPVIPAMPDDPVKPIDQAKKK